MIVRQHEPGANVKLISKTLRHVSATASDDAFICVGDLIPTYEDDFLKGHGTLKVGEDQLQATLCGVVQRINKLILVSSLKTRYAAQQGDVVVGRVTAVTSKSWKVNLNSRQEAELQVTAVQLASGAQRRRNAEDELGMREVFREGDLVVTEVQAVKHEGAVNLQTRSLKFGKLTNGQLVEVPPQLIKRQKQHFRTLDPLGVDVILGCNGLIWVCPHVPRAQDGSPLPRPAAAPVAAREQREACVRVAGSIKALAALFLQVFPESILDTYQLSVEGGTHAKDMLERPFLEVLASSEVLRRGQAAAAAAAAAAAGAGQY